MNNINITKKFKIFTITRPINLHKSIILFSLLTSCHVTRTKIAYHFSQNIMVLHIQHAARQHSTRTAKVQLASSTTIAFHFW